MMIPANIISGFRTCGVYPFNPKAVLDHDPCVSKNNNPKSTDGNNPTDGDLLSGSVPVAGDHLQQLDNDSSSIISKHGNELFTAEEEILYQTRYSEGYDLHDPKYISWLKISHPDENCEWFSTYCEGFSTLMVCFQDASIPEEIPVSLCADTTNDMSFEGDDQLAGPAGACDTILPGSTPNRKDGGSCVSVSRTLVMKTPNTSESSSNNNTVNFTSAVPLSNNSTPVSNTSASALITSSSSMSSISTSLVSTSSTSTPLSSNNYDFQVSSPISASSVREEDGS